MWKLVICLLLVEIAIASDNYLDAYDDGENVKLPWYSSDCLIRSLLEKKKTDEQILGTNLIKNSSVTTMHEKLKRHQKTKKLMKKSRSMKKSESKFDHELIQAQQDQINTKYEKIKYLQNKILDSKIKNRKEKKMKQNAMIEDLYISNSTEIERRENEALKERIENLEDDIEMLLKEQNKFLENGRREHENNVETDINFRSVQTDSTTSILENTHKQEQDENTALKILLEQDSDFQSNIEQYSFSTEASATNMSYEELKIKFWNAIETNNITDLDDVYQQGFKDENFYLTKKNEYGIENFPAEKAVMANHIDVIKWLGEKGVDFDKQGDAVNWAAYFSNTVAIFKYFLDQNLDMHRPGPYGGPACMAAKNGNVSALKLLADRNVEYLSMTCLDRPQFSIAIYGHTPAYTAVKSGQLNVLKYLKEKNIDMKAKGVFQESGNYEHLAAYYGRSEILGFLAEEGVDLEATDNDGSTPAHWAIKGIISSMNLKQRKVLEFLNDQDVDLNAKDNKGNTPAHLAAVLGHIDVLKFLDMKGVALNTKNNKQQTLAHEVMGSNLESKSAALVFLNEKGVDLNAKDSVELTIAHMAAKIGDVETLMFLNMMNFDLNAKSYLKQTPACCAKRWGKTDALKYLTSLKNEQKDTCEPDNTQYDVPEYNGSRLRDTLKTLKKWMPWYKE